MSICLYVRTWELLDWSFLEVLYLSRESRLGYLEVGGLGERHHSWRTVELREESFIPRKNISKIIVGVGVRIHPLFTPQKIYPKKMYIKNWVEVIYFILLLLQYFAFDAFLDVFIDLNEHILECDEENLVQRILQQALHIKGNNIPCFACRALPPPPYIIFF